MVVDDEESNLDIIREYLGSIGYRVEAYANPVEALSCLEEGGKFDVILLDRMMPCLDGLTLLKRIKALPSQLLTPIIFQTAKVAQQDIVEGIEAGSYYYLTKPFTKNVLLAIVRSAFQESLVRQKMMEELSSKRSSFCLLEVGKFRFKTIGDANALSVFTASYAFGGPAVAQAISEILSNAIEHGNLEIGYETKKQLLLADSLEKEIESRLLNPVFGQRSATLLLKMSSDVLHVKVSSEGGGFDYEKYLKLSSERVNDPNGRGIALAANVLDNFRFGSGGRDVEFQIPLKAELIERAPAPVLR